MAHLSSFLGSAKLSSGAALAVVLLFAMVVSGCARRPARPPEDGFTVPPGTRLVVWDVRQPCQGPGCDYEQDLRRTVAEFEEKRGVSVEIQFVSRDDIEHLLLGQAVKGTPPSVIYTTELSAASTLMADVSPEIDRSAFLDVALAYWSSGDKILAVPAYVHWYALAARPDAAGESSGVEDQVRRFFGCTGYWVDSYQSFWAISSLPVGDLLKDGAEVASKSVWMRATLGQLVRDPLSQFVAGRIPALAPVNPYLFTWLRSAGSAGIALLPLPRADGSLWVPYTVPGYAVLETDEVRRRLASELACALAANLGRWVARWYGGLPARAQDAVLFNAQSCLSLSERKLLLGFILKGNIKASPWPDLQRAQEEYDRCFPAVRDYLSGNLSEGDMQARIGAARGRDTNR